LDYPDRTGCAEPGRVAVTAISIATTATWPETNSSRVISIGNVADEPRRQSRRSDHGLKDSPAIVGGRVAGQGSQAGHNFVAYAVRVPPKPDTTASGDLATSDVGDDHVPIGITTLNEHSAQKRGGAF